MKRIDAEAFSKCNALQEVFLPYAVVRIRSNAFEGCQNLETVVVSNPSCQIEGMLQPFRRKLRCMGIRIRPCRPMQARKAEPIIKWEI